MAALSLGRRRLTAIATVATLAAGLPLVSHAQTTATIRVWKIGSPHTGDTPDTATPVTLSREIQKRGMQITVESFPAKGFAAMFSNAVARGEAPDVLVFDNMGVIRGITTSLGTFPGIGEAPAVQRQLVGVTGAFDELLGPKRGWTYLFALSANHAVARALALEAPACPTRAAVPDLGGDLSAIVPAVAKAYLNADSVTLQPYADPDRLQTGPSRERVTVGGVRTCGLWGNDRLAIASVTASYDAGRTIGAAPVVLVFRKPLFQWQLLVASRDPITNARFVKDVFSMTALEGGDVQTRVFPAPATLLSPATGEFPRPFADQRFGNFSWRSSASDDVVAEVAEFAYHDDARLFLRHPVRPDSAGQISAGQLWATEGEWVWRVWSISSAGDVTLSDARHFQH